MKILKKLINDFVKKNPEFKEFINKNNNKVEENI
jgi:hypothetical protein